MRETDETTCFSCGSTVRRDVGSCPYCGSSIAAGPEMATPATIVAGSAAASTAQAPDVVGPGRYVINFLLAGLIGLVLTYFLRGSGWLATWICVPIFILIVMYFATAGAP